MIMPFCPVLLYGAKVLFLSILPTDKVLTKGGVRDFNIEVICKIFMFPSRNIHRYKINCLIIDLIKRFCKIRGGNHNKA